jgi:peroxiredoxin Q/BCP
VEFRERIQDFNQNDTVILGISRDTPAENLKFKEKNHLPYPLLSDIDRRIAFSYGAMNSPTDFAADRISFLIDENGIIKKVISNTKASEHPARILEVIHST